MAFFQVKLHYLHQNPVRAGIVAKEEEYVYSSSCDFNGNREGLLELAAIERSALGLQIPIICYGKK